MRFNRELEYMTRDDITVSVWKSGELEREGERSMGEGT